MPGGLYSKSTPTLPTVRSLNLSLTNNAGLETGNDASEDATNERPVLADNASSGASGPSEPASVEDNLLPDAVLPELDGQDSTDEDELEDEDAIRRTQTLPTSKSYTHLRPMSSSSSMLFPPFYNRPPTPLPPSPSLTSLLRPSFNSRPTTPDSSDVEGIASHAGTAGTSVNGTSTPTSTAAAVAKSARTATTVPRASPKIPTYEYYGFAVYLASSAAFLMYLLWSFLPSPILHQLGIYYYPNRWWALAVPAWLIMAVLWIYAALAGYNTEYLTLKMNNIENLVDETAQIAVLDSEGRIVRKQRLHAKTSGKSKPSHGYDGLQPGQDGIGLCEEDLAKARTWKDLWDEGTDAVMDVPIGGVCEILYGDGRDIDDDPSST